MNKNIIEASKGLDIETIERGIFTMVCLIERNRIVATGIARRCKSDKPNRTKSYSIALGRARKALFMKQNSEIIRNTLMG